VSQRHQYRLETRWTGNRGSGTSSYRDYGRDHDIVVEGKPVLAGSSDPSYRGDASRHNPEDLLVASLLACHMLWYLHLCAEAGVCVTDYLDRASGTMAVGGDGGGYFEEVVLAPRVTIAADSDAGTARDLHQRAHGLCFIANSVNFPVRCRPEIVALE
jgi:organic hydroperoxide reductase OsmC/OhrA